MPLERGLRTYLDARGLDPDATDAEAQVFLAGLNDAKGVLARERQMVAAALLLSVGTDERFLEKQYGARVMEAAHPHRRMSLKGAIEMACIMDGRPRPDISGGPSEWLSAGFSTVSLPGILGDSANKSLLFGYQSLPGVVPLIFGKHSVTNFREYTEYRVTGDGTFQEIGPGGEIKHGTISEEHSHYQAKTHGLMFNITRTMLVNDDTGAFLQIPQRFGRGAALTREKAGAKLIMDNTGSFFVAAVHKNLSTGAGSALGAAGIAAACQMMLEQTDDADGKNPIMITPKVIVVPPALKGTADELFKSDRYNTGGAATAERIPNSNIYQGLYQPYAWPFLGNAAFHASASDKKWYLFSDPNDTPAFLVAYLNGIDTPIIEEVSSGPNVLGTTFRAYFDFGVAQGDYRAAVRSNGE